MYVNPTRILQLVDEFASLFTKSRPT